MAEGRMGFYYLPRRGHCGCQLRSISSMLYTFFVRKSFFSSFFLSFKPKTQLCNFGAKILYKKCAHKTLMKLTPGSKLGSRPNHQIVYAYRTFFCFLLLITIKHQSLKGIYCN